MLCWHLMQMDVKLKNWMNNENHNKVPSLFCLCHNVIRTNQREPVSTAPPSVFLLKCSVCCLEKTIVSHPEACSNKTCKRTKQRLKLVCSLPTQKLGFIKVQEALDIGLYSFCNGFRYSWVFYNTLSEIQSEFKIHVKQGCGLFIMW